MNCRITSDGSIRTIQLVVIGEIITRSFNGSNTAELWICDEIAWKLQVILSKIVNIHSTLVGSLTMSLTMERIKFVTEPYH